MDKTFRKIDIELPDKTKLTLQQKPIKEIFTFGNQPYIILGISGAGKTVLCKDLIYNYSKEATAIYCVTDTKENLKENSMESIHKIFKRKPTFDNLKNIWNEIVSKHDAMNSSPDDLFQIILTLYGQKTTEKIREKLKAEQEEFDLKQIKYYKSMKYPESKAIENSSTDYKAYKYELLRRIILFGVKKYGDKQLTQKQLLIVRSLVSRYPKQLLIIDDITDKINGLKHDKTRVEFEGQKMSIADAFEKLMDSILTRGRHYCLVAMFVHSVDIFKNKDKINNFILFDSTVSEKVQNARTISSNARETLKIVSKTIFENYKFYFVNMNILENQFCVGKAELRPSSEKMKMTEQMNKFIEIYDNVDIGFKGIIDSDEELLTLDEENFI